MWDVKDIWSDLEVGILRDIKKQVQTFYLDLYNIIESYV